MDKDRLLCKSPGLYVASPKFSISGSRVVVENNEENKNKCSFFQGQSDYLNRPYTGPGVSMAKGRRDGAGS